MNGFARRNAIHRESFWMQFARLQSYWGVGKRCTMHFQTWKLFNTPAPRDWVRYREHLWGLCSITEVNGLTICFCSLMDFKQRWVCDYRFMWHRNVCSSCWIILKHMIRIITISKTLKIIVKWQVKGIVQPKIYIFGWTKSRDII